MNNSFLIVGNGGREYAVAKKLSESKHKVRLNYLGSEENPGISKFAKFLGPVKVTDTETIKSIVFENSIDSVFIGPEAPLEVGIVDQLRDIGIPCIGPSKKLARIETSKIWSRELVQKYGLSQYNPDIYGVFSEDPSEEAIISCLQKGDFVVKPDGLHGGKGVKVNRIDFTRLSDAVSYIKEVAATGERVLIEEKLVGKEFSLISLTDGINCLHTIPVQDYKRAYEGDKGPNTGSMGSVTGYGNSLDFLDKGDLAICYKINETVVRSLYKETGDMYTGILYGSYIKTDKGIKIIEFNCRFGDPEAINILHLLRTDLVDVFNAMVLGTVDQIQLDFSPEASVFKYKVPIGYPDEKVIGEEVSLPDNSNYIMGSIGYKDNKLVTLGSRTIGSIETGDTIMKAAKKVNLKLDMIKGKLRYRKDIGMSISYQNAGVDIDEGNRVVTRIRPHVESTFNEHVISEFGDFAGMLKLGNGVLVASTDGVGTKSLLVVETFGPIKGFEMLGHDIVNHCINDTLVKGAKPLFFLDYFASSKIDSRFTESFVKGVSDACREVGCVLLGGETAEMPDVYREGAHDIVGTMVGVVKEEDIINGKQKIRRGDLIVGLPSSGPHTNGYTLIRKILESMSSNDYHHMLKDICAPHKSYYRDVAAIKKSHVDIHGLCHITGGGFIENPPRILPEGLDISWKWWEMPEPFRFIQACGNLSDEEMRRVFNCGIGMLVFIDPTDLERFPNLGEIVVGEVV